MPRLESLKSELIELGLKHSVHFQACMAAAKEKKKKKETIGNKISHMADASGPRVPNAVRSVETMFDSAIAIEKSASILGAAKASCLSLLQKGIGRCRRSISIAWSKYKLYFRG